MFDSKRYSGVSRHKILIGVLCLLTLCVWARHTPDDPPIVVKKTPIKTAVDDPQKVDLEYANELQFEKDIHPDFQILSVFVGEVCTCFVIVLISMKRRILWMLLEMYVWNKVIPCLYIAM